MKPGVLSLLITLAAAAPQTAFAGNEIEILDAWIAEAPPVSRVQAGYLQIRNDGAQRVAITGMTCRNFSRTEFHRTVDREGVAGMERRHELVIPPGETLRMMPGGYHVMLFEPVERLRAGDETACELRLGELRLPVTLQVRKPAVMHDHSHHHH